MFDLDPGEGVTMTQLCEVAHAVRELMHDVDLTVYPLTSGSRGCTSMCRWPNRRGDGVVVLARRVAQQLEQNMPTLVTATMTKSLRVGKVFLDWSQNNAAKTTIAPIRCAAVILRPSPRRGLGGDRRHRPGSASVRGRAGPLRRHGDLLAGLDGPVVDALKTYRVKGSDEDSRTGSVPGPRL